MAGERPGSRPDGGHRPASVTLRTEGESGASFDPANQSLAEALGLIFRIVQFGMVVLFAAFALSGFSSVAENQRGIKLLFGRDTARDLLPGFHFSAPYPLGEMVKVDAGQLRMDLDESFFPRVAKEQPGVEIAKLAGMARATLKPGEDGALMTADGNLAHSRWSLTYSREGAFDFSKHVLPDHERAIVRAAVERGIVQAVAQVTIDDLLKQSSSDQGSLATRAREIAQRSLDAINSGIRINQLSMKDKTPPLPVYADFTRVQSAESEATGLRDQAEATARTQMNAVAGAGAAALVEQIEAYERAIALKDTAEQARVLAAINGLFEGREVKIGEKTYAAGLASGAVTNLVNDARQYQSSEVSRRQAEVATFRAKLAQYRAHPGVVMQREWADAMSIFLDKPQVQVFNTPRSAPRVELWVNPDPDLIREAAEAARLVKVKQQAEVRASEQAAESLKTRTDTKTHTAD